MPEEWLEYRDHGTRTGWRAVSNAPVGHLVREGDIVLLAVDNHAARALLDRHVATLRDATLISGGNDETDDNVQVVRRRNGWSVDGG